MKEIRIIKEQLDGLLNKELEWKLKFLKQKEFEGANKPGKLLAWQIKKKREKKIINKIVTKNETLVEHNAIKREFYNYYANLFKEKEVNQEKSKKKIRHYKYSQDIGIYMQETK